MQQKTVFSGSASQNCRMVHDAETDRVIFNLLSCPPLYDEVKVKFLSSVSNQEAIYAINLVSSFE